MHARTHTNTHIITYYAITVKPVYYNHSRDHVVVVSAAYMVSIDGWSLRQALLYIRMYVGMYIRTCIFACSPQASTGMSVQHTFFSKIVGKK